MDAPSPLSKLLSSVQAAVTARRVQVPVTPMHSDPDALSEQVSQALLGQEVTVVDAHDPWRRIRTPDGYEGWVAQETLALPAEGWDGPQAEIEDLWVNLRGRPDSRLAPLAYVPIGTRLPIQGGCEGWVELLLPDGRHGWVESHRVIEVEREPLRPAHASAICRTARRFLGVPYLWGGCSPAGLDCSGFVQLVMRLHGIHLLRDADVQSTQGESIDPAGSLRPADLVFFSRDPSQAGPDDPGRITHVGMMVSSHRFIHALGSRNVRINSLNEGEWRPRLQRARRFL